MASPDTDSVLTDEQRFAILMLVISVILFIAIRRDATDS